MSAQAIDCLLFDAVGTLFRVKGRVGDGYARIGEAFGFGFGAPEAEAAFRAAWKAAGDPFERIGAGDIACRERGEEVERHWWRELVGSVLVRMGFREDERFEPYFDALWAHYARGEAWELFPETRDVLDRLSSCVTTGVVSNFDGRLRGVLKDLELLEGFDFVLTSADAGARKPARAIFELALERAGAGAGQTLHCGDDPQADGEGASRCGIGFYQVRRPGRDLRGVLRRVFEESSHG